MLTYRHISMANIKLYIEYSSFGDVCIPKYFKELKKKKGRQKFISKAIVPCLSLSYSVSCFLEGTIFTLLYNFCLHFLNNYITRLYSIIVRREAVPLQGTSPFHLEVNSEGVQGLWSDTSVASAILSLCRFTTIYFLFRAHYILNVWV